MSFDPIYNSISSALRGGSGEIEKRTRGSNVRVYGIDRPDISDSYKIIFFSPGDKGKYDLVRGYLNEDFREEVVSKWGDAINLDTGTVDLLFQTVFDKSTKSLLQYRQVWEGNDPFKGKFILNFHGESSAFNDVYKPVRVLQKMASPGTDNLVSLGDVGIGRVLTPPVPAVSDPREGVVIRVGRMFEYVGALISSVNPNFSHRMDSEGYPLFATVEVSYQLINPALKSDFDSALGGL